MAAPKSDFAQKLLSDLRVRKEKLAATQNSNGQPQSGQISSREKHGNQAVRPYRSAQQTPTQSAVYRPGNSNRKRATSFSEPSNQLVLYETGQNSGQVTDLSTAIAYAFENTGKLQSSGSNPLVNFFKRFGRRRSMDCRKTNTITFDNHTKLPAVSHVQITEISNGVEKINQILRVCSNGINFDRNSFEVGKELLKGSIDLEESLRLLVNLQEASAYNKSTQQKTRIRFLDEEEDEEEETGKIVENWQVSRPRFSFDNTSRNSYIVQGQTTSKRQENVSNIKTASHKRSISYDQKYTVKENHSSRSLQEKGRVSNVIAKLMGLEDATHKEEKEKKVPRRTDNLAEPLNRERRNGFSVDKILSQSNSDNKLHTRPEKMLETMNERSRFILERNKPRKDSNVQSVGTDAVLAQYHASVHYQGNEHRIFQNHERELNLKEKREKKMPQKARNGNPLRVEDVEQNKSDRNLVAKRSTKKDFAGNQHVPLQVHKKRHTELKDQHLEKKSFLKKKREENQVESNISSKSEKTGAANIQKKILHDIFVPSNGKPRNFAEKVSKRESPNSSNRDVGLMVDTPKAITVNEDLKKEDKNQNISPRKPEIGEKEEIQEKMIPASVTEKKAISQKVDKSENISKIDVLVARRNASMNQLPRLVKQTTNMLQDLERHLRSKNHSSKRKEQPSDNKDKDGKAAIIMSIASEKNIETVNQPENLQNEPALVIKVENPAEDDCKSHNTPTSPTANQNKVGPAEDECKIQNTPISPNPNENYNDQKEPGDISDYLQEHEPGMPIEEQEVIHCDQINEEKREKEVELDRLPAKGREQEHLTELEKELKEIVLKSQMFLNAAEALFKLNIPISFLHTTDHNCESPRKKLLLDCGYDIMKRKTRRHEMTLNQYTKTAKARATVSSFDELVKQLCVDIEVLKTYGGNGDDVAESLHEMLKNDIYDKVPDANNMWDYEWNKTVMTSVLPEKEHVIRDVEKYMLNGLLDEITNDLLLVNVSA